LCGISSACLLPGLGRKVGARKEEIGRRAETCGGQEKTRVSGSE